VFWQESDKALKPSTLIPARATTIGDVVMSITLVQIDDPVGIGAHKINSSAFLKICALEVLLKVNAQGDLSPPPARGQRILSYTLRGHCPTRVQGEG
jgi:hypothetical protein